MNEFVFPVYLYSFVLLTDISVKTRTILHTLLKPAISLHISLPSFSLCFYYFIFLFTHSYPFSVPASVP